MYQINYNRPVHVHFIGIGGISMSGLAAILLNENFTISGSDAKESALTIWLSKLGASIVYGQRASNITDDIDAVVYTAAIHPDNPEFLAAQKKGIPMLSRAELLGQLMRNYNMPVAVAGTHGKTTTTSMLAHLMMAGGLDPTISVGGILQSIGGNIRIGSSDVFLTEACEYTNSFLELSPSIGIILNIEADHLDFFRDLDDIRHSFRRFAEKIPADGTLILESGISDPEFFTRNLPCRVVTFGLHSGGYHAADITYGECGTASFTLVKDGVPSGTYRLSVPGEHNVSNAVAALAAGDLLSIPREKMAAGLLDFTGTDRRFQKKGEFSGITVVDDYAHHPTEIRATLRAAANYPKNTLWCVFQPHTYSRTKALLDDFAEALSLADKVVLADIYAARESDNLGISSDTLREKIAAKGKDVWYFPTFGEIEEFLLKNCAPGDIILTMGAGDIVKVGEDLLKKH